jgi:ADP-ribose pyrophosphatase YjhB (NUDIX family)
MQEECNVHSLICDVAMLVDGSVLLVRYADLAKYDGEGGWFLPDDVLRFLEHPTRAAQRIAQGQLGLELDEVSLGLIESFRGNDESWHMSFHHKAELPARPELRPAADVAVAEWFPLDELPPRAEVAHHGWALSVLKRMVGAPAR